MNNSNDKVKESYDKRLNFIATGLLLFWILIFIFGIFSLKNAFLLFNLLTFMTFQGLYLVDIHFLYTMCIAVVFFIGFFPSRSVSISLINLFKNRRWREPSKFIIGISIQSVTASIASILTIIFYKANNFTEFFSLFSSFAFIFSIVFLGFCLYYYRYDLPEPQIYRNQRYTRF